LTHYVRLLCTNAGTKGCENHSDIVRNVDHIRTIILKNERQSKRVFIQSEFLLLAL